MDDKLSTNQRMADALLRQRGSTLVDFLTAQKGIGASYESIAKELYVASNGSVDISYGTVKRWLKEFGLLEAAS